MSVRQALDHDVAKEKKRLPKWRAPSQNKSECSKKRPKMKGTVGINMYGCGVCVSCRYSYVNIPYFLSLAPEATDMDPLSVSKINPIKPKKRGHDLTFDRRQIRKTEQKTISI